MTNSLKSLTGKVDQVVVSIAREAEKSAPKVSFETYEESFGHTENQFGTGLEASRNNPGARQLN